MGKTGMVRVLCLLRFHPKGNLCGVKNKVQINRPFHSYVQVLVKTSKIIYREYFMESAGVRYLRTSC